MLKLMVIPLHVCFLCGNYLTKTRVIEVDVVLFLCMYLFQQVNISDRSLVTTC